MKSILPQITVLSFVTALCAPSLSGQETAATPTSEKKVEALVLSPFTVTAELDQGYMASNAVSATMTDTPIKDIPGTVTVVNAEFIRDLGATSLAEMLRFAPGVNSLGEGIEGVQIRGFGVAIPLIDGYRESPMHPSPQAHVERVEVLSGPAGLLYGNTFDLGGVVNRITKQPSFTKSINNLSMQVRDHDAYQLTYDLGRKVNDAVAYRLILNGANEKSPVDYIGLDRLFIRPNLTWRLSDRTTLSASMEYLKQRSHPGVSYNPIDNFGTVNARILELPEQFNIGQDIQKFDSDKHTFYTALTHRWGRDWFLRVHGYADAWVYNTDEEDTGNVRIVRAGGTGLTANRYVDADGVLRVIPAGAVWLVTGTPSFNPTSATTSNSSPGFVRSRARNVLHGFVFADLTGKFVTGPVKHRVLTGVGYTVDDDNTYSRVADMTSFKLADAGGVLDLSYASLSAQYGRTPKNRRFHSFSRQITLVRSAYLTDTMSVLGERLFLVGGVRYDENFESRARSYNAVLGTAVLSGNDVLSRTANAPATLPGWTVVSAKPNYMPRYGVVVKPWSNLSLYYSHTETYIPATGQVSTPNGFINRDPRESEQDEAGFKASLLTGGRITLQGSLFDLTDLGTYEQVVGAASGIQEKTGQVNSKGGEFSVAASPFEGFQAIAGYSYTEATQSQSATVANVGLAVRNVPRNRFSLWTKYYARRGAFKGLGLGFGTNWVDGSRKVGFGQPVVTPNMPSYTIFEASVSYSLGGWNLGLNVKNLTDELYYVNAPSNSGSALLRGMPRQFIFSSSRSF